jgi:preprotein translocase subunit SecY
MSAWRKPLTWAAFVAFAFVGSRVSLAGIDVKRVVAFIGDSRGGLLGLYEMVFQGGLNRGGILALGIMPYLSARVYLWLWAKVSPGSAAISFEARRRRTRLTTTALALAQSVGFATFLRSIPGAVTSPATFMATTMLTLTATSLVAMWFGEQLTERDEPDLPDVPLSDLLGRPEAAPALPGPALPASPPLHPHPSSAAETVRTRQ